MTKHKLSLSDCLVVGISSRSLFDLEDENRIFEREGFEAYSKFQREHEEETLKPGAAYPLVQALLRLNNVVQDKRLVEVIVMSRNSPDTGLRVLRSIESLGIDISRASFSGGASHAPYLEAFDVDLFLSKSESDVQSAIDAGFPSALIYDPPQGFDPAKDEIRIAFDADAVLFSEESEKIFQEKGLAAFAAHERENARSPLREGPFAKLLKTLSFIQKQHPKGRSLIRIAIVTARGSPAHERVIRTLREWEVDVDEAFFLGGLLKKSDILKAFRAHIYFDDQDIHLSAASKVVPSARVPYHSSSTLKVAK